MVPFVGRTVERCVDEEHCMAHTTQKARAAKKGCRIHVGKTTRLEQEGASPAMMARVFHKDLSEGDKENFREVARQEPPPPMHVHVHVRARACCDPDIADLALLRA
jgi:hypothetical protein